MGITGAPFGRTELLVPPLEPQERDLARGKGPRGPGGWGVGKKLKNDSFFGPFFLDIFLSFFERSKNERNKLTKSVKFARIELILIPPDSPHRVLDSPGVWANFSKK